MPALLALFRTDILAIRRWFADQTVSKLLVIAGFMAIAFLVSLAIYSLATPFFQELTRYEKFGWLTVNYLIHAAILLIGWLAVGSSIASTATFLINPRREIRYLLALPVKPDLIICWNFIKTAAASMMLMLFILSPLAYAYAKSFISSIDIYFLIRVMAVFVFLTLITHSLGGLTAYIGAPFLQKYRLRGAFIAVCLFLLATLGLIRLIFPPQLIDLYYANAGDFEQVFRSLPLASWWLPTQWLTALLMYGFQLNSIYVVLLAIFLTSASLELQQTSYIRLWHAFESRVKTGFSRRSPTQFNSNWFLIQKDWLSIIRSPAEVSYALFLFSMAVLFFLLLSASHLGYLTEYKYQTEMTLASAAWFLFFTTAFLLRIVFPLMTREGGSSWYIFTQPVSKEKILASKLILGLLLMIPFLILQPFIWPLMPFAVTQTYLLITGNSIAVLYLALTMGLIGAIKPNFRLWNDAEKASTGTFGIVSLIYSFAVISGLTYVFYGALKGTPVVNPAFIFIVLAASGMLLTLFSFVKYSLAHYQF